MSGDGSYAPKSPDLSSFYSAGPTLQRSLPTATQIGHPSAPVYQAHHLHHPHHPPQPHPHQPALSPSQQQQQLQPPQQQQQQQQQQQLQPQHQQQQFPPPQQQQQQQQFPPQLQQLQPSHPSPASSYYPTPPGSGLSAIQQQQQQHHLQQQQQQQQHQLPPQPQNFAPAPHPYNTPQGGPYQQPFVAQGPYPSPVGQPHQPVQQNQALYAANQQATQYPPPYYQPQVEQPAYPAGYTPQPYAYFEAQAAHSAPSEDNHGANMPPRRSAAAAAKEPPPVIDTSPVRTKFPTARIKRIMQADEEVGKVAQQTPIAVGKALELFMVQLVTMSADVAREKSSKRVTAQMLKQVVESDDQWDFLREIVSRVENEEKAGKAKAKTESDSEEEVSEKKKGKGGRKKKV